MHECETGYWLSQNSKSILPTGQKINALTLVTAKGNHYLPKTHLLQGQIVINDAVRSTFQKCQYATQAPIIMKEQNRFLHLFALHVQKSTAKFHTSARQYTPLSA